MCLVTLAGQNKKRRTKGTGREEATENKLWDRCGALSNTFVRSPGMRYFLPERTLPAQFYKEKPQ